MPGVEADMDRILTRLRNRIRARSYTQREVQEALGWGRGYISQLVTKKKILRADQLLMILDVIGVSPEDFFGEVYRFAGPTNGDRRGHARGAPPLLDELAATGVGADLRRLRLLFEGLVAVLKRKGLIRPDELEQAVDKFRREI